MHSFIRMAFSVGCAWFCGGMVDIGALFVVGAAASANEGDKALFLAAQPLLTAIALGRW